MLVPANLVACRPLPDALRVAGRVLRSVLGLALFIFLASVPGYAKGPEPAFRIPLDSLGFLPLNQEFLVNGGSMLTVHFVDDQHLLVTFNARTLLKRIPNDPPEDLDRNVAAFLLELPSGRILARTEWRFHDHGQYLWSLGHGRFLLRVRDTLTTIAPLANLATGDPFHQRPFLNLGYRRLGFVFVTPESDLLILETKPIEPETKEPNAAPKPPLFGPAPPAAERQEQSGGSLVQVNFFRLATPPGTGDEVRVHSAGVGHAKTFGGVLATSAGMLELIDQGHKSWAFNFNTFTGKVNELSPFDSTCRPMPMFVSRSEFIAFGCHLGGSRQVLGGFNMRAEEMWEQTLYGDFLAPSLVFAPASGRFALGRVTALSPIFAVDTISQSLLKAQTVVVYQTDSGDQILKVDCSPIELAGQNFALSPDGLSFGVVRNGAVELYKLPPLTSKQQAAVKLAQASAPKDSDLPVELSEKATSPDDSATGPPADPSGEDNSVAPSVASTPAGSPTNSSATTSPATSPTTASSSPPPAAPVQPDNSSTHKPTPATSSATSDNASGDPQPSDQPRKPPTLYNLPSDTTADPPKDQPK